MSSKLKIDKRTFRTAEAEVQAAALCLTRAVLRPKAARDEKRHAGACKPRGSRRPKLDAWLDKQDLRATNSKLWAQLPTNEFADVYRDGEVVYEDGRTTPLGRAGFNKRATAARKRQERR